MIIGNRIKNARLNKNLSQETLGKLLGVSKVSISGYETGRRQPSLDILVKIADYLDLDLNYLLGRDIEVVSEAESNYFFKIAQEDLTIIRELKKHPVLYNKITQSPQRTIKLINQQIIKK